MKMSIKPEITEEFRALCESVASGSIVAKQREGEPSGYTEAVIGEISINGYPWCSAELIAKSAIENGVKLKGIQDTKDFYWMHAMVGKLSIGCIYSRKGKKWQKSKVFKFPAQVALESLRSRLDRGAL
jgi:hypothetical protein